MGIDIYVRWDGQTEDEKKAQYTGFDITAGAVGYLREAYHGNVYATRVLVPEAFEGDCNAAIPAATLRERLPATIGAHIKRMADNYERTIDEHAPSAQTFVAFVDLVEAKERAGLNPIIHASY
jgi:hypothetical protein